MKRTAYQKEWRLKNPDKVRAYGQKWRANNKEKRRAIERSWRTRNRDKVRVMNAKGGAKWSKSNPSKRNAIGVRRMLAKIQRTPSWADQNAIQVFYDKAAQLTKKTGIPHEVDHIYPLQGELVSGLHVETNLQVIPRYKNRSKQNRTVLWQN